MQLDKKVHTIYNTAVMISKNYKQSILSAVKEATQKVAKARGQDTIDLSKMCLASPPNKALGDLSVAVFFLAKTLHVAVQILSQEIAKEIKCDFIQEATSEGAYINLRLARGAVVPAIFTYMNDFFTASKEEQNLPLLKQKIMLEYSSPNTNKPLHLGHLRNDALGESLSRILKAAGANVFKVNIINDRGIHICKSMAAYMKFHEANHDTPETMGKKSDHFVGDCYVEFDKWQKENPEANDEAAQLLRKWEAGDDRVRSLWQTMNKWAQDGIMLTYKRTGVSFDKIYKESETYLLGKDKILQGVKDNIFYKKQDGSVCADVTACDTSKKSEIKEKVLLRQDGTSVYITQDIGTAILRHEDWAFDKMIYVVASEQNYHFRVLFYLLKKLGYSWASQMEHRAYGLVNLPSGRMKSREGTVVDADDLLDALRDNALENIKERDRLSSLKDPLDTAEKIAIGALHYYLLQTGPNKDMLFNPEESLSFSGNTGPYLQYCNARICSIIAKLEQMQIEPCDCDFSLLKEDSEWELLNTIAGYDEAVFKAAKEEDPSVVATFLHNVAVCFNAFYRDCPIISLTDPKLLKARQALIQLCQKVLSKGMDLILVPILEAM